MKKLIFSLCTFSASIILFLLVVKTASASNANFNIMSTTNETYRCYASSLIMQDKQYTVLISCQDIVYPIDGPGTGYIVWATPKDGTPPIKFGALNYGFASFRTGKAFDSIFVTTEQNPGTRTPTGPVVMRGSAEAIPILERPLSPTPTTIEGESDNPEVTPTPANNMSTRERILVGLRRAGLVALLAFVALVGLVFVITRSRG